MKYIFVCGFVSKRLNQRNLAQVLMASADITLFHISENNTGTCLQGILPSAVILQHSLVHIVVKNENPSSVVPDQPDSRQQETDVTERGC